MTVNTFRPFMLALSLVSALLLALPAAGSVLVTVTGSNTARADFALGGTPASPLYSGTLFLTFDAPVALSAANLNIGAHIVDPTDPALRARLSGGSLVSVPSNFPVMISVSPPAGGGFEFINAAQVELYTAQLSYTTPTPYRLYKAPAGGMFFDITEDVLAGSIRCRSRTGGFSDFMMVIDLRSASEAAEDKLSFLEARLDDDAIAVGTRTLLELDLDEVREEFLEGDYADARAELDDLELRVDANAGSAIPNRWRAANDLDNIAGSLESEAAALDFYLRRLIGSGGGGGDDDGDDD